MADLVEDLEAEAAKLAKLDAELRAQVPAEIVPVVEEVPSWYDSAIALEIGIRAGHAIGEGLIELFRNLIPTEEQIAAARARAPIASAPAAIVPAPVPVESKQPTSTSNANESEIHVDGLVGHIEDRRALSPLATEPFSAHVERLGLESDLGDQVREPKLKGPIIA